MRLALFTDIFKRTPVEEAVELAAIAGFRRIELNACEYWDPHVDFSTPHARNQVEMLERALSRHGVQLAAVATASELASLDPDERRLSVEYCRKAMAMLDEVGCKILTAVASGNNLLPVEPQKQALRTSLLELAEESALRGWRIAVEIYPGHCLESTTAAVKLLASLRAPQVGLLYCVSHIAALGEDLLEAYNRAKARIIHVHLSDTPVSTIHHQHLIPGHGEVDCTSVLRRLQADTFPGIISLQIYSHADRPIESAMEGLVVVHRLLEDVPSPVS